MPRGARAQTRRAEKSAHRHCRNASGEIVVVIVVIPVATAETAGQYEGKQDADSSQPGKSLDH
ncbi:hypothetical protein O7614_25690 [Micromonospora sp. WMMD961]|uniref:hypothetical protein n=1 Tax=Micromonospora sp. WMMD961 TaxID=3016100 RepID=UPI0024169919|nr:hypothetical protein [Micromonospora sp. WMMD961]MDG4783060.1 hypothetical protein [Micromonospora sp. WMMD961]